VADIFTKAMIEKKETNLPKEIGLWQWSEIHNSSGFMYKRLKIKLYYRWRGSILHQKKSSIYYLTYYYSYYQIDFLYAVAPNLPCTYIHIDCEAISQQECDQIYRTT
jgi:hypothetical protein